MAFSFVAKPILLLYNVDAINKGVDMFSELYLSICLPRSYEFKDLNGFQQLFFRRGNRYEHVNSSKRISEEELILNANKAQYYLEFSSHSSTIANLSSTPEHAARIAKIADYSHMSKLCNHLKNDFKHAARVANISARIKFSEKSLLLEFKLDIIASITVDMFKQNTLIFNFTQEAAGMPMNPETLETINLFKKELSNKGYIIN